MVVATQGHVYEKVVSNIQEVRARGAEVIAVATAGDDDIREHAEHVLYVPRTSEALSAIPAPCRCSCSRTTSRRSAAATSTSPQPRQVGHGRVGATMSVPGLGVDIVEIDRMRRALERTRA